MMRSPRRLPSSWLLSAILALGLAASACSDSDSPTQPTPPANTNETNYTAVGASDAIGFGGSIPCFPFADCPTGTGYVPVVGRRLSAAGRTVTLVNLGIPGAVLSPEVQVIGNNLGRGIQGNFLEREMPFVPRNSTLVTIFAGGNDANTIGEAVRAGQGGADPVAFVTTQTNNFGRDMRSLVTGIKGRAANARIIVLNLPNLAGLPYAANLSLTEKRALQTIAVGFSAQTNGLTQQNALVIDLMCDPRSYIAANYSTDGFHPNDAGYAYIADLVYAAASTGSVTPPRASCPQMALF
jgi:lysophospholipase L1-like esterase